MRPRLTAFAAVIMAGLVLMLPLGAHADETSEPADDSPAPTAEATANTPPEGSFVGVTLINSNELDADGKGTPVPGVTLRVSDLDGAAVGEGVTDVNGRAFISIPERGTYTVELDTSTLPPGVELSGEGETTRTIQALLDGGNYAQFQIGVEQVEEKSFTEKLGPSLIAGVKLGLILALATLGLSLIFGTTGLTNFAHGELLTFGALMAYVGNRMLDMPVILAGIFAVIVSAGFGWANDRGLWRPLRRRGTGIVAMMIVSIGLGLAMRNIYQYFFGSSTRQFNQYTTQKRQDFGFVSLAPKEVGIIVIALVAITVVCIWLMKSRTGKAIRAVSDNPALSASSGLKVDSVISTVWILGAALTGLAGVLHAVNQQINFLMGYKLLLLIFAAVILGGLGTIWGSLLGALVIGIMVEAGTIGVGWWPGVPTSIRDVGALAVLILILLIRPEGILGRKQRIG